MEPFEVDRADVERAVDACGLFDSVTGAARDLLLDSFSGLRLVTGEALMSTGDDADSLYIVRHGRLRAAVFEGTPDEVKIGEVGKGEVVGEMGVITDQPRTATVRASRDTDVFRMPAAAFAALVQQHPQMLRPFATVVVDRLRSAMEQPARPSLPATIAFTDLGGGHARRLADAIAANISDLRVRIIEKDDAPPENERAAWLLEMENRTDLALLITDPEPTPWTRRCLRHADRAMLVADAAAPAGPTAIETDPETITRFDYISTHLVVVHRGRAAASKWLAHRTPTTWTNVRLDHDADMSRLAREMTGRANIFVLSGGGARGFAHFGVAKAMRESGIPIDGIMGASAGSVVGALLARVGDPVEAQRQMLEWFERTSWRRDLTPPTLAITTGRLMTEGLQELGDGALIEDLPIEFTAVSCDLVTTSPIVHDRGPVWQAIRASGSVPGLFPPVRVGDQLLVDGGLVANMPTELARARHPDANLIAVDVGDPAGIDSTGVDGSGIANGWSGLRPRHNGVTLLRLLVRLTELGRHDTTESADFVIEPDVKAFGITESARAATISQRGYEAGLEAADALKRILTAS
jgi:NTE family protein